MFSNPAEIFRIMALKLNAIQAPVLSVPLYDQIYDFCTNFEASSWSWNIIWRKSCGNFASVVYSWLSIRSSTPHLPPTPMPLNWKKLTDVIIRNTLDFIGLTFSHTNSLIPRLDSWAFQTPVRPISRKAWKETIRIVQRVVTDAPRTLRYGHELRYSEAFKTIP